MKKFALIHRESKEVISIINALCIEDAVEILAVRKNISKWNLVNIFDVEYYSSFTS